MARAIVLNRVTVGYNVVEAVVALVAGVVASSSSLLGFGLDSVVEVGAALALTWRLGKERGGGCMTDFDARANRAVALSMFGLAGVVSFQAVGDLVGGHAPDPSPVGIAVAALSLAIMPWLARQKAALAVPLGSQATASEATHTNLCALMSAVLLVGLGLNAVLHWWWADPVAALGIAGLAVVAGARAWRAEAFEDTCCD